MTIFSSGHWIADPCEFGLLSAHVLGLNYLRFIKAHGEELGLQETESVALLASFGSTAAQAHNQGRFSHLIQYRPNSQLRYVFIPESILGLTHIPSSQPIYAFTPGLILGATH